MNNENYSVLRYGMLTTEISSALQDYADDGTLSVENKEVLREGSRFLRDIVDAQRLFTAAPDGANGGDAPSRSPSHQALGDFTSALGVVMANRKAFEIASVPDLDRFFQRIHWTLQILGGEKQEGAVSPKDVESTCAFFEEFADSMLARLSNPVEAPACRMVAA